MKYIEELSPGDIFTKDNKSYLMTVDFKKDNSKLCYSLQNVTPSWFKPSDVVIESPIYFLDETNNVVPVRPIYNTPQNIS